MPPSRREPHPDERERRVTFAGRTLGPGRHAVALDGPGGEISATVLVGARAGPRAVLLGGLEPGDSLGLAVTRRVLEALDGAALAGSVVLLPRLARDHRFRRAGLPALTAGAAFVVELRAGEAGWNTVAHLRADLGTPRAAQLARAFGAAVVVDAPAGSAQLRFEAGERGRWDARAAEDGAAGVLSLLGARGIARAEARRPPLRLVVEDVVRLRLRRGGTVVPAAPPGALVGRGGALLAVYDAGGRERAVLPASQRAVILATRGSDSAAPGSLVARVGRVRSATRARVAPLIAGWSEWIALPELGIRRLHAKLDTGARTSALHVLSMRESESRLEIALPLRRSPTVRVDVVERIVVRDSGGHAERRPVIETTLVMGPLERRIRLTLTHRGDMQFPMLVGRSALGDQVLVDANRRNLLGD